MNYWDIYKDVWNFHKRFSKPENSEKYWLEVAAVADEIQKKYQCDFAVDMLVAVIKELERKSSENAD